MTTTILITGTSSGFGNGAAKALARQGHRVFASMRGVDGKNANVAAELRTWAKDNSVLLDVVELDVTSDESVRKGVAGVIEKAGAIDILINNAGVGTWGVQEAFSPEQIKQLFDVNVVGMLRVNREVLPHMRRAKQGYIIYVSSGLGRVQLPFLGPYTASKHAVEAIAESGSYELKPLGIDTTILQPGAYGTAFLQHSITPENTALLDQLPPVKAMYERFAKGFEARAQSGQLGDPAEIIDAMLELVAAEKNARPLRKTVGADIQAGVTAINNACESVQKHLRPAFEVESS